MGEALDGGGEMVRETRQCNRGRQSDEAERYQVPGSEVRLQRTSKEGQNISIFSTL